MRKAQKEQLLEILQTLQEAHKAIKKYVGRCELEQAVALLGECQRSAIEIGELVEKSEGENCPAVQTLENYCEELYQISQNVSKNITARKAAKKLYEALKQVESSVKTEIPVRMEIAFFPYKASMFDSMKSVWRAADADPDCDVYVVPIPYYDLNPDGSLGRMHYEGGMYPPDVPVVDWRTYDLEKVRPDVAFIHNPYDDQNLVTQVHSAYFSRNLKKHVGLLCYIPYFVAAGSISPHLAYTPAVLYSDFTIVESEEVRGQYLAAWEDLVRRGHAEPGELKLMEHKILPLGSPKFDSVSNGGETEIPDSWKNLIFKPDGSRKTVIFYNTSISGMLSSTIDREGNLTDQYLKKLESVLDYCKKRGDVVLLWRPHPLLGQTFCSMRPQLYERYQQLVRDYREAGYGIYDESADLHRAIETADAYYGDGSSVLTLWEKTEKPYLLQNPEVVVYQKSLFPASLYFDGDSFWCPALDFNGLFRIDRDTLTPQFVGRFPGERVKEDMLYQGAAECGGKLYFAPYNAGSIGVYDKASGQISSIALPAKMGNYSSVFVWKDSVFVLGGTSSYILKIDTETQDVTVLDQWAKQLFGQNTVKSFENLVFGCQVFETLYFPSCDADAWMSFDMERYTLELHSFPEKGRNYTRCIFRDGQIWFCSKVNPYIGIYDINSKKMEEIKNDFFFNGFNDMEQDQRFIYGFSSAEKRILKIDPVTHKMERFPAKTTGTCAGLVGGCAYVLAWSSGQMNVIDLETMKQTVTPLNCPDEALDINYKEVLNELKKRYTYAYETGLVNLDALILAAKVADRVELKPENCGEIIFRYIKDALK